MSPSIVSPNFFCNSSSLIPSNNRSYDFLKGINSTIYKYTLGYIFGFIGYITGYTNSVERCYGFNVSTQVDNINSILNDINSSFKKVFFGNLLP